MVFGLTGKGYKDIDPTNPRHRELLREALRAGNRQRDGVFNPDPADERYKYGHNRTGNRENEREKWKNLQGRASGRRALMPPPSSAAGYDSAISGFAVGASSRGQNLMNSSRQGPSMIGMPVGRSFVPLQGGSRSVGGVGQSFVPLDGGSRGPMMRSSHQGPSLGVGRSSQRTITAGHGGSHDPLMRSSRQGPILGGGSSHRSNHGMPGYSQQGMMDHQGMVPQQGMMPQQGMLPQQGMMPQQGIMPQQQQGMQQGRTGSMAGFMPLGGASRGYGSHGQRF